MALIDHIAACNRHDLSGFRPFLVGGEDVGWVRHQLAGHLAGRSQVFDVTDSAVSLRDDFADVEARTAAMAEVCTDLAAAGALPPNRAEEFSVIGAIGGPEMMRLDRGWVPAFGVPAMGIHVNGFVDGNDDKHLWIGVRSADSTVDPGKFDNMIAGGQPAGLSLQENLLKEAEEEAMAPASLAGQAAPVSAVTYTMEVPTGLRRDILYIYDLEVPDDFRPASRDGEHTQFELMPAADALRLVDTSDRFKFNVNLVIIDFAIRHGILTPDHPDYMKLLHGLRAWS